MHGPLRGPTMHGVNAVVLVPVKAFADAKARLSTVLDDADRERLARWTSERVLAAAEIGRAHV